MDTKTPLPTPPNLTFSQRAEQAATLNPRDEAPSQTPDAPPNGRFDSLDVDLLEAGLSEESEDLLDVDESYELGREMTTRARSAK